MRLGTKAGAFADLGGYHSVVPGDLEESELYVRVAEKDEDMRMPPSEMDPMPDEEIALIRRWIVCSLLPSMVNMRSATGSTPLVTATRTGCTSTTKDPCGSIATGALTR